MDGGGDDQRIPGSESWGVSRLQIAARKSIRKFEIKRSVLLPSHLLGRDYLAEMA